MWALVIDGLVQEITDLNPVGRFHESLVWIECDQSVQPGWEFSDGAFSEPPGPSIEALTAEALSNRDQLLVMAQVQIAPLQYAVDASMASAAEISNLLEWKKYSIAIARIQLQSGFPANIVWPAMPALVSV